MAEDIIKLLPDSVANQIAAGEVIQRPASVIKELVENSVDAGARHIQVIIKDAGKTLIQVIDDGCGMSAVDARMAFERHATSKIRNAADLFTLHTMGFRGEALPSVAAVSEIEMRTMRAGDTMGTKINIKASEVESQVPDVCTVGTNIAVKHLFYNFVARRRFLKKDSVELSHIMREFERLALVNPNIDLSITHNGTVLHQLLHGTVQSRIGALFGRSVEKQLIPIGTETALVKISGFIGLPSAARQRNHLQYFFVNGRNMRHPYFHKAVLNCYSNLIGGEAQPNYFINFQVDPERIDVNVHPQKHEIKFEDEAMVWQVLTAAIKESLGKYNVAPAIDFDAVDVPDIPPMQNGTLTTDSTLGSIDALLDPNYDPFEFSSFPSEVTHPALDGLGDKRSYSQPPRTAERRSALNTRNWEELYRGFENDMPVKLEEDAPAATPQMPADPANDSTEGGMIQIKGRWIGVPTSSGLMLIDQHRAHVRVLFDSFNARLADGGAIASQRLIFEEKAVVDAAAGAVIADAIPLLQELGFDVKPATEGITEWLISAVPGDLGDANPVQALLNIAADLAETGENPVDDRRRRAAIALARTAAIPNGSQLTQLEMQCLVSDLLRLASPSFSPDGLPVIHTFTAADLARLFHR